MWHGDATVGGGRCGGRRRRLRSRRLPADGAIARFSPVMEAVAEFAAERWPRSRHLQRLPDPVRGGSAGRRITEERRAQVPVQTVDLRVETTSSVLTNKAQMRQMLRIPINHFEGNYVCERAPSKGCRTNDQIVLRYVENPNGSLDDIAGICNDGRNVVGLMPHPERASEAILGSADGAVLLRSLLLMGRGRSRPP